MVCSHMISMYMVWHTYGLNRPYVFKPYVVWHTYGFTGRHMVCAHMVCTHVEMHTHGLTDYMCANHMWFDNHVLYGSIYEQPYMNNHI